MAKPNYERNTEIDGFTLDNMPIWTPWIFVPVGIRDGIETARAVKLGSGMTMNQAWEAINAKVDERGSDPAIGMTVKRDNTGI
ncbi:MAG: hypothetical protein J0653_08085 [Deltaproteobacteria bacterium]|nr:hypothetical protein [Deltaproteobacteria bacterium]